jgi:hypothetical protein
LTEVSEELVAFIFRVKEKMKQETSVKRQLTFSALQGSISQKVKLFITTAVTISDFT